MTARAPRWPGFDRLYRDAGGIVIVRPYALPVTISRFRSWDDDPRPVYHVGGVATGARSLAVVRCPRLAWRLAWRFARTSDRYERQRPIATHRWHPDAPGNVRWRLAPGDRPEPVIALGGPA